MNIQSIIILLIIIVCVISVIISIYKAHKRGKNITCSGGCSACSANCPYSQIK